MNIDEISIKTKSIKEEPKEKCLFSEEQLYKASRIQESAYHYNFDEGHEGIYKLLEDEFCDKSTALIFYWLNQPLYYLNNPESNHPVHNDGRKLKNYLEQRVLRNEFKSILQFVPIDFIQGPMQMLDELKQKESFLDEIPKGFFSSWNQL